MPASRCKKQKCAGGSIDYTIAAAHLPPGPSTLPELLAWPRRVVTRALIGDGQEDAAATWARAARLHKLCKRGIVVNTEYSGKQGPEFSMLCLQVELKKLLSLEADFLSFYRAADLSESSLAIMKQNSWTEHIFGNVLERVQAPWLDTFARLFPEPHLYKAKGPESHEKVMVHHAEIQEFLEQNRHAIFKDDLTCECHRHKRKCRVYPPGHRDAPLRLDVAGPCCTPWSAAGQHRGMADPASVALRVWVQERCARQEDGIDHEMTLTHSQQVDQNGAGGSLWEPTNPRLESLP